MIQSETKKSISANTSLQWVSESAVLLSVNATNEQTTLLDKNKWLQAWAKTILSHQPNWLVDCITAYSSLLIEFNPEFIDHYGVGHFLRRLNIVLDGSNIGKTHSVPVCYEYLGEQYPNDMSLVAQHTTKSVEHIISMHAEQKFRVFAVGFMPNFAYLGELHESIHMPRLQKPRLKLPAGAVAIADNQTAVYPNQSPGGWHILGYTPLQLLHSKSHQFAVGDTVVFEAIAKSDYYAMKEPSKT